MSLESKGNVTTTLATLQFLVSVLTFFAVIYHSLFFQRKFSKFFMKMQQMENQLIDNSVVLESHFISLSRKSKVISLIVFLISSSSSIIILLSFSNRDILISLMINLNYQIPILYCNFILITVNMIIISIKIYLISINHQIKCCSNVTQVGKLLEDIKIIVQLFSHTFGMIIYISFLYSFCMYSFEIFDSFRMLYFEKRHSYKEIFLMIVYQIWLIPNIILTMIIGQNCSKVGNLYEELLKTFNNRIKSSRPIIEILQVDHTEDLRFHANGLFFVEGSLSFEVFIEISI